MNNDTNRVRETEMQNGKKRDRDEQTERGEIRRNPEIDDDATSDEAMRSDIGAGE